MDKMKIDKRLALLANFRAFGERKSSEYSILGPDGDKIAIPTIMPLGLSGDEINKHLNTDLKTNVTIISDDYLNMLSPDYIDSREFWKYATKIFPYYSVAGSKDPDFQINSPEEVNGCTIQLHKFLGGVREIDLTFSENPDTVFLEIGPGYGNIQGYIVNKFGDDNYYGIDVCPLFDHPRLFQCDGRNIPSTIPYPVDMVYSINVFQHLSKAQRTSYYKQIYEILSVGGSFVFGMFVKTNVNKDWPVWGLQDKDGNPYCGFLNQYTRVDTIDELLDELDSIGFYVRKISNADHQTHYLVFKCVKTDY